MLKSILLSGPVLALIGAAVLSGVAFLVRKAVLYLSANPKTAPLAPMAVDAGNLLDDEVKTLEADIGAGKSAAATLKDLGEQALSDVKSDIPDAEKALEGEVSVLVNGAPAAIQTAPGGAAVNMPRPGDPKAGQRGLAPFIIVIIIAAIALAGGTVALVATGNSQQALSCVEQAVNANPAGVGNLVSGLSAASQASTTSAAEATGGAALESAVETFGPDLAKCIATDLWDDTKASIARNAALKTGAPLIAPVPQIINAAQVACVAKGWYPAGTVAGTSSGSTGSTTGR